MSIPTYFLHYFSPFFIALLVSTGVTPMVIELAKKLKVFDYPNPQDERKIHQQPKPLLGGLALIFSFLICLAIFWSTGLLFDREINQSKLIGIIIGTVILAIGGFLDDKYNIKKAGLKFAYPVLAALSVIIFGMGIFYLTNPLGGILYFGRMIIYPLTFLWLLGMMFTTKFLDGLDGLATGIGLIGSIIIFLVSLSWDVPLAATSVLALILAGVLLGFLFFNFYPAKIFLGEAGSLWLGFMLGVLSIISGSKIATTLLIMGLPILDVAWVIIRRLFKEKKSPFMADRKHFHFRLMDTGFSLRKTVLILYLLTLMFGSTALLFRTWGKIVGLIILVIVMVILGTMVVKSHNIKHET